jgi:uncharacterized protein (TIGR02646 family)
MIQLQAVAKPVELTDDVFTQLTDEYKKTEKAVWKKSYITKALLKMSFDKCCFCETKINEESKYLEIDHFHPKKYYEEEVVLWMNLLPTCKRCNGSKSDHDTVKEPIIHPVKDNPKNHLRLKSYRFYGSTELGKCTVIAVDLNNRQRLVKKRFEIGDEIIEKLIDLLDLTKKYSDAPSNRGKNRIIGNLENIMSEGTKESEYCATAATIILTDENYKEIKQLFKTHNLWSNEFIELEQQIQYCALI